jgi:hypothetical protein
MKPQKSGIFKKGSFEKWIEVAGSEAWTREVYNHIHNNKFEN